MTRLLLFVPVLLLVALPVAARQETGELRGQIVEMGTSRPLAGAEIGLPALKRWTLTEQDGTFRLGPLPLGEHRVEITHLGYRTHEAVVSVTADGPALKLELWPDPVVLEGLTVQSSRLQARLQAIPQSTRVVALPALTGAFMPSEAIRRSGEAMVPCRTSMADYCLIRRGRPVAPVVYIDERLAFGLDELNAHPIESFQRIEIIGHQMIRAYTVRFMERLALGKEQLATVLLN
jgi:hypothetical protein